MIVKVSRNGRLIEAGDCDKDLEFMIDASRDYQVVLRGRGPEWYMVEIEVSPDIFRAAVEAFMKGQGK